MMLSISVDMTLSALIILPIYLFLYRLVVKNSQKYFKAQQDYLGDVNGQVEELYRGHNIVQAFNGEEDSIKEFNKINNESYIIQLEISIFIRINASI